MCSPPTPQEWYFSVWECVSLFLYFALNLKTYWLELSEAPVCRFLSLGDLRIHVYQLPPLTTAFYCDLIFKYHRIKKKSYPSTHPSPCLRACWIAAVIFYRVPLGVDFQLSQAGADKASGPEPVSSTLSKVFSPWIVRRSAFLPGLAEFPLCGINTDFGWRQGFRRALFRCAVSLCWASGPRVQSAWTLEISAPRRHLLSLPVPRQDLMLQAVYPGPHVMHFGSLTVSKLDKSYFTFYDHIFICMSY